MEVAADYFNLEATIGYENWAHNRPYNYPSLHVDKDEKLYEELLLKGVAELQNEKGY